MGASTIVCIYILFRFVSRNVPDRGPDWPQSPELLCLRFSFLLLRRGTPKHLASGAAYLWLDDPSSCDAPVQKAGSRGAAHPPEALARVHSLCDGTYAVADEHRRSA